MFRLKKNRSPVYFRAIDLGEMITKTVSKNVISRAEVSPLIHP